MAHENLKIEPIEKFLEVTAEEKKQLTILKKRENVFYLLLNNKLNTFNRTFLREINSRLDEVEANDGETALITMGFNNKYFSTGMDLGFIKQMEMRDVELFVVELMHLYGRISSLCVPTICLMNGHAIAGGLMLAFAHDYIYMRDDFG